jgi:hypothetical protein
MQLPLQKEKKRKEKKRKEKKRKENSLLFDLGGKFLTIQKLTFQPFAIIVGLSVLISFFSFLASCTCLCLRELIISSDLVGRNHQFQKSTSLMFF